MFVTIDDMIFNEYNSSDDGQSKVMKYDAEVVLVAMLKGPCLVLVIE